MSESWHPTKAARAWAEENAGKHLCEQCGEPVKLRPSYHSAKGDHRIPRRCSWRCLHESQRKAKVTITCVICSKTWLDFPSKVKLRKTCSKECLRLLQRQRYKGKGNPNYRGGMAQIRLMIHNSTLYDNFRADVLRRDGFKCHDCGSQAAKKRRTNTLDVHHIVTVEELLSKIFDPDNGLALCPDCHTSRHQQS